MDRVKWLNGQIDYSYDQPALKEDKMGWNERANHGYGFAFDTSLQGTIANHWKVNINLPRSYFVGSREGTKMGERLSQQLFCC